MRASVSAAVGLSIISGSTVLAADIRVMSGGAPKEVLAVLTPEFEKQTGHKVHFTYIVISQIQQRIISDRLLPRSPLQ